jgi:hypothetical protein
MCLLVTTAALLAIGGGAKMLQAVFRIKGRDGKVVVEGSVAKDSTIEILPDGKFSGKAPRRGDVDDNAIEVEKISQVVKFRIEDLLEMVNNIRDQLNEVKDGKLEGRAASQKVDDMNNGLTDLYFKVVGYGLGRDPYLDGIPIGASGIRSAKPPPDYGIMGPYVALGLPRLYERYLKASGISGKEAEKKSTRFKQVVKAYANPVVCPHRDIFERNYYQYRFGKGLGTPQFAADIKATAKWLEDLRMVLEEAPRYFK